MGLKESADSWRRWAYTKQQRGTIAATYRPLRKTTLRALYEKGFTERQLAPPSYNALDGYSLWKERGSIVKDGYAAAADRPNGINQITGAHHTFIENSGSYYNAQNTLISTFENLNLPVAQRARDTMLPEEVFPYNISPTGPGSRAWQYLRQGRVFLEQQVTDRFAVELAFNKMWNLDESYSVTQQINVVTDPNLTVPATGGGRVANPLAGALYMEKPWLNDTIFYDVEHWRATASYDLDLGKWFGRHRLAGLLQSERTLFQRRINVEILVDQNGIPITNANPDNTANLLYRRNYLAEGDYETYYPGNASLPFTQVINGRQYTTRWVTRNQAGQNRTDKADDAWMLATQSYFWKDRLAVLFGYRSDSLTTKRYIAERVRAGDPRIASGARLLNEWDFSPTIERMDLKPVTRSLGAVFHLTRQVSFSYNESANVGQPVLNLTIIPESSSPPPTRGKGNDYGVRFELGEGRGYLRINRFESSSNNEVQTTGGGAITGPAGRILDALLARGVISQSEYETHLITGGNGLGDSYAEGTEVSLTANPSRHWTLQLNYSYTDQSKRNYYVAAEAAVREEEAWWRSRITAAGLSPAAISTGAYTGSQGSVEDEIHAIFRDVQDNRAANELGFGKRPHKANLFTRYTFPAGPLKGALVGGGLRYQSKSFNQRDVANGVDYWGDVLFQADLLLGYRTRLSQKWRGRPIDLSVQVNIRNVFDETEALVARLNDYYAAPRRVYFQEPRNFRLTTTLSF